jgi:hypothetical protein
MRNFIFLLLFFTPLILLGQTSFNQPSDFIVVKKKNNRTVKSFFPGSLITLETITGNGFSGPITEIRNDSVFIRRYDVRAVPNYWGTRSIDTLGSFVVSVHYKEIAEIVVEKRESFGFIKNGTIFIIGGAGYIFLNLVNGKYKKEPISSSENAKKLGIAAAVMATGVLLNVLHRRNNKFSRKYVIQYIRMHIPPAKGV